MAPTVDQVVERYIQNRDLLDKLKKEYETKCEKVKDQQEKLTAFLMGKLNESGLESMKTQHGTCFVDWKDSATVADREAFFDWIEGDFIERKQFLENRVSKTAVKALLDDGETLPPGVNYTKIKDIKVRRK